MQKSNSLFVTVGVLVIIISLGLTMASAQNKQAPGSTQNIKIELTKEEQAFLKAHPVIRFGTDGTWDPFVRKETDGTLKGLDVDFINYINQVSGANIELVTGKWNDIVNKAKTHEIDGLATSAALKNREPYFNFTNSYISVFTMVILRSDSTLSVTGLSDLKGKTVAVQKENAFIRSLLEPYPEINTIEAPSELDAVGVMVEGKADAAIGNAAIYNTLLKKFQQSIKIGYFIYDKPTNLLYSIRKDWPLLTAIINKSLASQPQEKKNRIFVRWFGFSPAEFDLSKGEERIPLTALEQAWIKAHPEIRLGVDPKWQPMEFIDEKGKHQGISSDYVRILNRRLGLKMKIVPNLSWTQVMDAVPKRDVDVLPGVATTPEREKHLNYSEPYIYIDWVIITRIDAPKINSLADLVGRVTAVDEGYPSQYRIEKQFPKIPLLLEPTTLDALQSVIDGKAEAAVVELSAATLIMHSYRIHSLKIDQHVFQHNDPIAFAVRNDWPELVQILNKGLASITHDERETIEQKWLAVPINIGFTKKDMLRIVLYVVAVMGIFLVFFLFWNRRLKKEVTGRIKTEKMLRESEDKFRSFAEQSLVGIYLISGDVFKYVNPKFAEIFGYSVDECLNNMHFPQLVHPEDLATVEKQVDRRLSEGTNAVRYSFRGIKKSGEAIHVEIFGSSMVLKGKTVATGTMLDITERKQTEEAVWESEEKLRTIIEHSNELFYICDTEHTLTYVSQTSEDLLGYTPEEMMIKWTELATGNPLNQKGLEITEKGIASGEKQAPYLLEFTKKNGTSVLLEIDESPVKDASGKVVAISGAARDVTEQRRTEQRLLKSEKGFRDLFDSITDLIYTQDLDGCFITVNHAMSALFGYEREAFIGRPASDFMKLEMRPFFESGYLEQIKTKRFHEGITSYFAKNGNEIHIEYRSSLVEPDHGERYISGSGRDVTERVLSQKEIKRLQNQILQSQKMEAIGLMAGGIAHDLNNILSGIVSYPELLLLDIPVGSPMRKPMETIKKSGMRAVDVVSDLVTIARGIATVKEVLNLNTIVTEYLDSIVHRKLESTHSFINFKTELNADLLNMTGSSIHINKTLMNLVINASEAIEGNGTVTISTTNRYLDKHLKGYDDVCIGEYVVLSVSDDGSGISSEDLEKIFEPFYTKKVMGRSGTGLGLAVVWNSVQDHNGYIDVKSSEEGTVFELYFRVTRDQIAEDTGDVPAAEYQGHGEKILVVDDEENQREIACGMLAKLGYIADAVSSGEEAIEYMKENTVDLIVLDMVMPKGINGRETYQQIIKIRPGQKAIIASGYAKTKEVDIAQRLGAGKYIKKPYILEKIGLAVKEELEK